MRFKAMDYGYSLSDAGLKLADSIEPKSKDLDAKICKSLKDLLKCNNATEE